MNNSNLTDSVLYEEEKYPFNLTSPIILFLQIFNFSLGIPLNMYVIVLLIRGRRLEGCVIFSLSQTVSEILFSLQAPLFILCQMNKKTLLLLNTVIFSCFLCMNTRVYVQCLVCLERYLAVVHPVFFRKYKVLKYRLSSVIFVWVYSFLSSFFCMKYFTSLPFTVFGSLLGIVLSMHLFFCFSILRALKRPGPGEREMTEGGSRIKKKAFEIVFCSLLTFLIQTIPVTVAFSLKNNLSSYAYKLAFNISFDINIAAGLLQPLTCLYQMGKLISIRCDKLPKC